MRVIVVDRLKSEVDLGDVVLKRVRQVDRWETDLGLTGAGVLPPVSGAGSGFAPRDPKLVALDGIIRRINTLLAGDLEPGTVEGSVRSAATEVAKNEQAAAEIDANEIDQFRKTPAVPNKVVDAVVDFPGLIEKLTGEAIGNPDRIAAIAGAAYLMREIDTVRHTPPTPDGLAGQS